MVETPQSHGRVTVFDTTLRDAEQTPGASLTVRDKLEIAQRLARLRVDVIEAGFPISSNEDFEAVHRIGLEVGGPRSVACRAPSRRTSTAPRRPWPTPPGRASTPSWAPLPSTWRGRCASRRPRSLRWP